MKILEYLKQLVHRVRRVWHAYKFFFLVKQTYALDYLMDKETPFSEAGVGGDTEYKQQRVVALPVNKKFSVSSYLNSDLFTEFYGDDYVFSVLGTSSKPVTETYHSMPNTIMYIGGMPKKDELLVYVTLSKVTTPWKFLP